MALPRAHRLALLAVVGILACGSAGCPKLNRWSGPSQDPFFNVPDPLPKQRPATNPASAEALRGNAQSGNTWGDLETR